jgi:Serpin (serine protease inhibitor)
MPSTIASAPLDGGAAHPRAAIAAYTTRFHAAVGTHHHVGSPLGAWLLLSLVAPAATGAERAAIEAALGCPIETARALATRLLDSPYRALRVGLALWHSPEVETPRFDAWRQGLPSTAECGPIPTPDEANAWVRAATDGQIHAFPVPITQLTRVLLTSALATRIKWSQPFEIASAQRLGASPWARTLRTVLYERCPGAIAHTEAAGLVGTQRAHSDDGLLVVSAIAEESVAPAAALAAAYEVAARECGVPSPAAFPSLFDLPSRGHAWEITESTYEAFAPDERQESAEVLLPSWRVDDHKVDLMSNPAFGFVPAAQALLAMLPPTTDGYDTRALQVARAQFDRYGFEAAAVSSLGAVETCTPSRESRFAGRRRVATVRFGRPFAVVAVAQAPGGLWQGVPVFSAWITTPTDADTAIPREDESALPTDSPYPTPVADRTPTPPRRGWNWRRYFGRGGTT